MLFKEGKLAPVNDSELSIESESRNCEAEERIVPSCLRPRAFIDLASVGLPSIPPVIV